MRTPDAVYKELLQRILTLERRLAIVGGGGGGAPSAHASSHENGGSDELDLTGLSGLLATAQTPAAHASSHQNGGGDEISVAGLSGLLADGQTPLAHATSHQNGGSDEISVAGLSGLLADGQTPLSHASSHQNGGGDEISVAGLSGLLADGQTPLAHKTSHQSGGSDAIKLDDLAAPDDNTDLNASASAHGLLPKLSGNGDEYLDGLGNWSTPEGAGSGGSSGDVAFSGARVYNDANVALTNGSFTTITFNQERFDTDAFHSTVTNNSRLTVPSGLAGKYLIGANVGLTLGATSAFRGLRLLLNGATVIGYDLRPAYGTFDNRMQVHSLWDLAVGDYVEVQAFVNENSKNAVADGNASPDFWLYFVGS